MKRLTTAILIACLFVACGESGTTDATSGAPALEQEAIPAQPPPSECKNIKNVTTKLFSASLVATEAEGEGFSKMVDKIGEATRKIRETHYVVESYLEDYGPFDGGDDCLGLMASALKVAIEAVFGSGNYFSELTRDIYQLLIIHYPDSTHRLDAENFLAENNYPVPEPSV